MKALQVKTFPFPQQAPALPLQAGTMPATVGVAQLDMGELMNMMIMMMIVVMMMKMMTGAMKTIA